SCNIFSYNVKFYIHCTSWCNLLDIGMIKSVRNNSDFKTFLFNTKSCKRNSIYTNRSFLNNQFRKLFWKPEFKLPTTVFLFFTQAYSNNVYVSLNKITIKIGRAHV